MKKPHTCAVVIKDGAASDLSLWLGDNFLGKAGLAVCDKNTLIFARSRLPALPRFVFEGAVEATDVNAALITERISESTGYLVACGSGTIHDLTRFAAHKAGLPFVSFPTAASVDGFTSGVAAMTVMGRKVTYPSTPPLAVFADGEIYRSAPKELTASGVGDIVGKYISLFDWRVGNIVTGEEIDAEIYSLEEEALKKATTADPASPGFCDLVMECLITSGMAMQYMGNSRPASGAEHHLSHLWEMHCINAPTPALHGEKVGVSTLLTLEEYKRLARHGIEYAESAARFSPEYLEPVFGPLTAGIIEENTPDPFGGITPALVAEKAERLKTEIAALPEPEDIKSFLLCCGAKTSLAEIGLPDTDAFIRRSLRYAPYVRRRLTLLKLTASVRAHDAQVLSPSCPLP